MSVIHEIGHEAANQFLLEPLVFIAPGTDRLDPEWVATGTLFITAGGRVIVLTAGHNLERATREPLRLGGPQSETTLLDVAAGIAVHPDADIGLIVLKDAASIHLSKWACPLSSLAEDDEVDATKHVLALTGFPAEWTRRNMVVRLRPTAFAFASVTYWTHLEDAKFDDKGRFQVAWTEDLKTGKRMPNPSGISGGGLWRFGAAPPGELWVPSRVSKFLGVPVAWDKAEIEFAEPISRWRQWFTEHATTIDQDFASSQGH